MKKTTQYNLNLWEKMDRILMEDFNADNQQTETALAGLAEGLATELADRAAAVTAVKNEAAAATAAEKAARETAVAAAKSEAASATAAEKRARESADATEKTARETAVTALNNALAAERAAREAADVAVPLVKLADITVPAGAARVDIPVSDLKWAQYAEVWLWGRLEDNSDRYYTLLCNRRSDSIYSNSNGPRNYLATLGPASIGPSYLIRLSTSESSLCAFSPNGTMSSVMPDKLPLSAIQTLNIFPYSTNAPFTHGRVVLYGLKL